MAILCAWASMSENGTTEGTPGDQTGSEVKIGDWYYFGQTQVFRWKKAGLAKNAASLAGGCANNDHIGYGQFGTGNDDDRLSFYRAWAAVSFDIAALTTDCNTDCSAFIGAIVNACGVSVDPGVTTATMYSVLMATDKFNYYSSAAYTQSDTLLQAGDILCDPAHHCIMVIDDIPPAVGPVQPAGTIDPAVLLSAYYAKKKRYEEGRIYRRQKPLLL